MKNNKFQNIISLVPPKQYKDLLAFAEMPSHKLSSADKYYLSTLIESNCDLINTELIFSQSHSVSLKRVRSRLTKMLERFLAFTEFENNHPYKDYYSLKSLYSDTPKERSLEILKKRNEGLANYRNWNPINELLNLRYINLIIQNSYKRSTINFYTRHLEWLIERYFLLNKLRILNARLVQYRYVSIPANTQSFKKDAQSCFDLIKQNQQSTLKDSVVYNSIFEFIDHQELGDDFSKTLKAFIVQFNNPGVSWSEIEEAYKGILYKIRKNALLSTNKQESLTHLVFEIFNLGYIEDNIKLHQDLAKLFINLDDHFFDPTQSFFLKRIFTNARYDIHYKLEIHDILMFYCIARINYYLEEESQEERMQRVQGFAGYYLQAMERLDSHELLLENDHISFQRLKNSLTASLILKNTTLLDQIITKYKRTLNSDQLKEVNPLFAFIEACKMLHLEMGDLTSCWDHLNTYKASKYYSKNTSHKIAADKLYLKILYKVGQQDQFDHVLSNLILYIKRDHKVAQSQKDRQLLSLDYFKHHCLAGQLKCSADQKAKLLITDQIWLELMEEEQQSKKGTEGH